MSLEQNLRGLLDTIIDEMIKGTSNIVHDFRKPEVKSSLTLNNEDDFIMGFIMGGITYSFMIGVNSKGVQLTPEQMDVVMKIILNRSREIKEAIFKSG